MKQIIVYIRLFTKEVNKPVLVFCTLFSALLILFNFRFGLENSLVRNGSLPFPEMTGHLIIYCLAFFVPYLFYFLISRKKLADKRGFLICLIAAPLIFAVKAGVDTATQLSQENEWNSYWNAIIYWPARLLIMLLLLGLCWVFFHRQRNFYGLSISRSSYSPYFIMVLLMVPLIALAATQPDFLHVYPKMKNILPLPHGAEPSWAYKILYQLAYGSDFLSIELFFRGFLVVGFMKWMGKDAILPMACFYCSIHFGKPLGECISSYFGGILLGIVSYHTRSIYGGLIVHLGIAWMMELAGGLAIN